MSHDGCRCVEKGVLRTVKIASELFCAGTLASCNVTQIAVCDFIRKVVSQKHGDEWRLFGTIYLSRRQEWKLRVTGKEVIHC